MQDNSTARFHFKLPAKKIVSAITLTTPTVQVTNMFLEKMGDLLGCKVDALTQTGKPIKITTEVYNEDNFYLLKWCLRNKANSGEFYVDLDFDNAVGWFRAKDFPCAAAMNILKEKITSGN